MIRHYNDRIEAYTIQDKNVVSLQAHQYEIIITPDCKEPFWEERLIKVYSWRKFGNDTNYRQSSQIQRRVILHLSKLEDMEKK